MAAGASFRVESTVFCVSAVSCEQLLSPGLASMTASTHPGCPLLQACPPPSRCPSPPLGPVCTRGYGPPACSVPSEGLFTSDMPYRLCGDVSPRGYRFPEAGLCPPCAPGLDQGLLGSQRDHRGPPMPPCLQRAAHHPAAKCSADVSQANLNSWLLRDLGWPWGGHVVGGAESWAPTQVTHSEEPPTAQGWGLCQEQLLPCLGAAPSPTGAWRNSRWGTSQKLPACGGAQNWRELTPAPATQPSMPSNWTAAAWAKKRCERVAYGGPVGLVAGKWAAGKFLVRLHCLWPAREPASPDQGGETGPHVPLGQAHPQNVHGNTEDFFCWGQGP